MIDVGGDWMGISKENMMEKLQKEVKLASDNINSPVQFKQHISRITMLCDLLLEEKDGKPREIEEKAFSHELTEEDEWIVGKLYKTEEESPKKLEDDPYDIFDF